LSESQKVIRWQADRIHMLDQFFRPLAIDQISRSSISNPSESANFIIFADRLPQGNGLRPRIGKIYRFPLRREFPSLQKHIQQILRYDDIILEDQNLLEVLIKELLIDFRMRQCATNFTR